MIKFTLFEHLFDTFPCEVEKNWSDFCDFIERPRVVRSKEMSRLIIMGRLKNRKLTPEMMEQGIKSPRFLDNIAAMTGLIGDHDAGTMSVQEASNKLSAHGIHAIVHTTASHTAESPRWHVIVPYMAEISPKAHAHAVERIDEILGGGVLASESRRVAQAYFIDRSEHRPYLTKAGTGDNARFFAPSSSTPAVRETVDSAFPDLPVHAYTAEERQKVRTALANISADDRSTWIRTGMAMKSYGDAAREDWVDWSKSSPAWRDGDDEVWDTLRPTTINPGSLFYQAAAATATKPPVVKPPVVKPPVVKPPVVKPLHFSSVPPDYRTTPRNTIIHCHENAIYWVHSYAREIGVDVVYDEFNDRIRIDNKEVSDGLLVTWQSIAGQQTRTPWSARDIMAAIHAYALLNVHNPLTEFLDSLTWDGVPRIDSFFERTYGIEGEYARTCAQILFRSAIQRAYRPGCMVDQSILLVGPEGCGKSKGMADLFFSERGFVRDSIPVITDKDALMYMQGSWMIELPEIDSYLNRNRRAERDWAMLKAFLTRQSDRYRQPYGTSMQDRFRSCIFIGTTNDLDIFSAMDINRRFLPLLVKEPADLTQLREEREALWAEAVTGLMAGANLPYLDSSNPEYANEMALLSVEDEFQDAVFEYCEGKDWVRSTEVGEAIGLDAKAIRMMRFRIPKLIRKAGFETRTRMIQGRMVRGFQRMEPEFEVTDDQPPV